MPKRFPMKRELSAYKLGWMLAKMNMYMRSMDTLTGHGPLIDERTHRFLGYATKDGNGYWHVEFDYMLQRDTANEIKFQ